MDLNSIIKRCQSGEKDAFEELLKSVEKKAFATAYFISGNKDLAKDIVQETYLKCFINISTLKNAQYFNSWFYKILIRTSWNITNKFSKVIPVDIKSETENLLYDLNNYSKDEIDKIDNRFMLNSAIDKLSHNLKTVIILYYYHGMTTEEIAKITGSFNATIRSRLYYARNVLKKELTQSNDFIFENRRAFANER